MFAQMPKVIEIGRLQRLKQAVLGAEIRQPKAGIAATDDWVKLDELSPGDSGNTFGGPSR